MFGSESIMNVQEKATMIPNNDRKHDSCPDALMRGVARNIPITPNAITVVTNPVIHNYMKIEE